MGNKELVYYIVRQLFEDFRFCYVEKKRKERENVNGKRNLVMLKKIFFLDFCIYNKYKSIVMIYIVFLKIILCK